jgi:hypothetical protein
MDNINDDDVRLADLAIASNIMQEELQQLIWRVAYRDVNHYPGATWELMRVSKFTAVTTRQGRAVTITEVSEALMMPYSNAKRYLGVLVKMGRVKMVKRRYVHDLDRLDQIMASRANIEEAMSIVDRCLSEWKRLLPLLADQLVVTFMTLGPYLNRLRLCLTMMMV